ncbi:MAG: twin-arginine translocase subunit TatC [Gammaproteobacteria bacterium]|nr:twin-arginine translocase subunit TatC [Gammaproteobacteria bacterium]
MSDPLYPDDKQPPDREREHDEAVDNDEQPLLTHLVELRKRILRALLAIGIAFIPLMLFANVVYEWVAAPLMAHLPPGVTMIATEVASPFLTPFKLAAYGALILGMPLVLHQIWAFVAPGLYLREKKFAVPLLVSSIVLFYLGMAFAYFVVFPLAFGFFAATIPDGVTWMTDINSYLSFVIKIIIAFGIVFEIPIATMLIVLAGLSTPKKIARKRPYIVVGCFFIGMLLTPPDVISQVLLAIPAWILFELGILLSKMVFKPDEEAS